MKVTAFYLKFFIYYIINFMPVQTTIIKSGNLNFAIQKAISDFSKNGGKLYEKDSIFSISIYDTIYRTVLEKSKDGTYKWVRGKHVEGIVAVSILPSRYKFLLSEDIKIGSKGKLPSQFIEKNGKLFYWVDDDYPLTKEALVIYKKYNIVQDDKAGAIRYLDNPTDETVKELDYFFCSSDLCNFKKVISKKSIGFYDPPQLHCKP